MNIMTDAISGAFGVVGNMGNILVKGASALFKPSSTVAMQSPALKTTPSTVLPTYDKDGQTIKGTLSQPKDVKVTNPFGNIVEYVTDMFQPKPSPILKKTDAIVNTQTNAGTKDTATLLDTFNRTLDYIDLGFNIFTGKQVNEKSPEVSYYPNTNVYNTAPVVKAALPAGSKTAYFDLNTGIFTNNSMIILVFVILIAGLFIVARR